MEDKQLSIYEKEMTVSEVADALQVTNRTVLNYVKKVYPEKLESGVKTYLNEKEVTAIKLKLQQNQHLERSFQLPKTDLEKELLIQQAMQFQAEKIDRLQKQNQLLENKIQEDKPLIEFASNIQESSDAISIGEFAKILSKNGYVIGQNNLFKKLRELKMIYCKRDKNIPYQHAIEAGWFKYDEFNKKITLKETEEVIDKICTKITITGKGQVYVERKLRELQMAEG